MDRDLATIAVAERSERIFLNAVDITAGRTSFWTTDRHAKRFLAEAFETQFQGPWAHLDRVVMRKQLWPIVEQSVDLI